MGYSLGGFAMQIRDRLSPSLARDEALLEIDGEVEQPLDNEEGAPLDGAD